MREFFFFPVPFIPADRRPFPFWPPKASLPQPPITCYPPLRTTTPIFRSNDSARLTASHLSSLSFIHQSATRSFGRFLLESPHLPFPPWIRVVLQPLFSLSLLFSPSNLKMIYQVFPGPSLPSADFHLSRPSAPCPISVRPSGCPSSWTPPHLRL